DERSGKQSVLEGGGVNEWFDRGAGGAPGLERAVVLVVLEIASADEDKDAGGLVVERDERALQIIGRDGDVRHRQLFRALVSVRVDLVGGVIVAGMLFRFRE